MIQRPPAEPGMAEDEIDTPALVLDLDAFEANLATMAEATKAAGVRLRPHAKTHKSPVIARLQGRAGAVGQCVQKVAEAEILAWGGIEDILVSNEVVSPRKLARLAALARFCKIGVCADSAAGIAAIEAAAAAADVSIEVLVEIEIGAGRCGTSPGAEAVALARRVADSRHLTFGGLQAYHGKAQHLRTPEERRAAIASASALTAETVEALRQAGLACRTVGGAGTGTFALEAKSGVYNELQAGSYIFMDADYGRNQPAPPFRHSLFVLASVMSVTRDGMAVVDAGHKAVAVDSGPPAVWGHDDVRYAGPSDEHGQLFWESGDRRFSLDQRVRLVPGHCDPTVDRYDWYVGVRRGRVECLWPVAARGAMA
ncbi:D-serine deaminase, pyridoxal phosphate-dependent [Arboricoccus pini]|uniref:D-serine deaminase, pyridoxal phosphate-dependent n=1 Tax=Arboricoccus pini TaxID=1963835 RepID=A0A212RY42_9PROT|nr:DSD1 family PLP-dependent enzyme [Arboricoccus pini]SNB77623.1 D-serine deaminase, pyridoxal phosphate-dependent [Arboricoccus pini]